MGGEGYQYIEREGIYIPMCSSSFLPYCIAFPGIPLLVSWGQKITPNKYILILLLYGGAYARLKRVVGNKLYIHIKSRDILWAFYLLVVYIQQEATF